MAIGEKYDNVTLVDLTGDSDRMLDDMFWDLLRSQERLRLTSPWEQSDKLVWFNGQWRVR